MACNNTIQVLKGSVLTFKSEVQICNEIINLENLRFEDTLQEGLKVSENGIFQETDVTVTINNNTPISIEGTITTTENIDTLTVNIPKGTIGNDYPATITVEFKAIVDDLDAFLNANVVNPDDPTTLRNTGTFTAFDDGNATIGRAVTVTLTETNVDEYSPEVSGYSVTVCPEDEAGFDAKFCLNTICGEYPNGQYVLTIKPIDGISFPNDLSTIKAYTGCCCNNLEVTTTTAEIDEKGNLKITIKDIDIPQPIDDDSCNDSISVSIPYTFAANYVYSCAATDTFLVINGSMTFETDTDTLTELKNFGLYVNIDCGDLVGISKTVLC